MQTTIAQQNPNNPGMANMPGFLSQIFGAGAHGDAVYTDEALDRVITQMMEQTNSHSAPGPASAEAIAKLPNKVVDKAMMGQDGKAECSVCMDAVEIGDQVTELPCKHWFHGECVGAWLKEHDTCPHCRQGIMPKEEPEEAHAPRSPNGAPRHSQNPFRNPRTGHVGQDHLSPPGQTSQPRLGPRPSGVNPPAPLNGAFTQPGLQQSPMPGRRPNPIDPRRIWDPPGPPRTNAPSQLPTTPRRPQDGDQHRRRSSASHRSNRSSGNGNGGEGSSTGGNGVTGWFRNLRGGSNNGNR